MTWPTLTVEAAFGVNPLTVPTGGQWTDLRAYVRELSWKRGRNHELSRTEAGELTMRLNNQDRRFDPTHTTGPYYPNVRPMTRIRVRAVHSSTTYDLWQGYVTDWGQGWEPRPINAGGDAECTVQAVDAFGLLSLFSLAGYSEAILEDEPLAYWRLDEVQLATVFDAAGGEEGPYNGTYVGGPVLNDTPGPLVGGAGAARFADATSYVDLGAPDGLKLQGDLTIELWVNIASTDAGRLVFADDPYYVVVTSTGKVQFGHDDNNVSTPSQTLTSATTLTPGTWYHVACVRDASEQRLRIYVDGVLDASGTYVGDPGGAAFGLTLNSAGGQHQDGSLAHVAIYDQALTEARIQEHVSRTLGHFAEQLSGSHVGELLDAVGWPAGERSIDLGLVTIRAVEPSGNALEWLLRVAEDTENGILFVDGAGRIVFLDRADLLARNAAVATYGDSTGETIVYADAAARYDDQDLWTAVEVPLEGLHSSRRRIPIASVRSASAI
jgi:hypothetical protein